MNRIEPKLGPEAFKTYQIVAPLATHHRPATCSEIQCAGFVNGFTTVVESSGEQAAYIRARSGRRFTETRDGDMAVFAFPAGQACFRAAAHRVQLEREPFYVVRGGDHRGNPRGIDAIQRRAADWVDDFAEHQDKIATAIGRG